jgi:hypothetical protein
MIRLLVPMTIVAALVVLGSASAQPAPAQPEGARLDSFGDPLPEAAVARLGTMRFRHGGKDLLGFTADAKALLYFSGDGLHLLDTTTGKESKSTPFAEARGQHQPRHACGPVHVSAEQFAVSRRPLGYA